MGFKKITTRNIIILTILLFSFGTLLVSCSNRSDENNSKKSSLMLPPRTVHEVCMSITPEERLQYSFSGTGLLSFNIHYHLGNEILFPVPENTSFAANNEVFVPTIKQFYCLMWTNPGSESVELAFEYEKSSRKE